MVSTEQAPERREDSMVRRLSCGARVCWFSSRSVAELAVGVSEEVADMEAKTSVLWNE